MNLKFLIYISLLFVSLSGLANESSSVFKKLGLLPGDVITKINGTKIDSAESAKMAVSKSKDRGQISIKFKRQGKLIKSIVKVD